MQPRLAAADITRLLVAQRAGDAGALDRLFPLVYDEMRRMAHRQLRAGMGGRTLDTSALVHEAYLRLIDGVALDQTDRAHFFAYIARVMRHILVDHARQKRSLKRGGGQHPVPLDAVDVAAGNEAEWIMQLDEALSRLGRLDERLARVVECRFFAGMTEAETALALDVHERTVRRDWIKARALLFEALREDPPAG